MNQWISTKPQWFGAIQVIYNYCAQQRHGVISKTWRSWPHRSCGSGQLKSPYWGATKPASPPPPRTLQTTPWRSNLGKKEDEYCKAVHSLAFFQDDFYAVTLSDPFLLSPFAKHESNRCLKVRTLFRSRHGNSDGAAYFYHEHPFYKYLSLNLSFALSMSAYSISLFSTRISI